MRFFLFNDVKLSFEVQDPVALIEAYCYQNNFYLNYDVIPVEQRKIKDVNKIGARIGEGLLEECSKVRREEIDPEHLKIFAYNLDEFLDLDTDEMKVYIDDFVEKAIKRLLLIGGVRLSKTTKIFHTLYPKIIPMIDNPLQELYRKEVNNKWFGIFVDYYRNFEKDGDTWKNLTAVHETVHARGLELTKVRIYDILWWSFLKAKKLKEEQEHVNLTSIKW